MSSPLVTLPRVIQISTKGKLKAVKKRTIDLLRARDEMVMNSCPCMLDILTEDRLKVDTG